MISRWMLDCCAHFSPASSAIAFILWEHFITLIEYCFISLRYSRGCLLLKDKNKEFLQQYKVKRGYFANALLCF